jgi:hypothetical protein
VLNVKCLGLSAGRDYELVIYNIFGREIYIVKLTSSPLQGELEGGRGGWGRSWQINVESLPPGLYIAVLKNGVDLVDNIKFIIAH